MNREHQREPVGADRAAGSTDSGRVGSFRFYSAEQRWEWSPAVARMHGYEPGGVVPTTELVLSHKHPDDVKGVAAIIEQVTHHGRPFSSRHRIIDTGGHVHLVVVVGDLLLDDTGDPIGTTGFYVDITEDYEHDLRGAVDDVVAEFAERRAAIEQAKLILMIAYSISPERAFDVLAWRSQQTNIKLRDLAAQFVRDVLDRARISPDFPRQVDHLLLTAHARVRRSAHEVPADAGIRLRAGNPADN